jgi:hypothetical protein
MAIPYLLIGNIGEPGTHLRHTGDHYERLRITCASGRAVRVDCRKAQRGARGRQRRSATTGC